MTSSPAEQRHGTSEDNELVVAEAIGQFDETSPGDPEAGLRRLVDHRWAVLLILFGAMGALGLPLIWMSRAFTPLAKLVWSIVVIVYTVALIWGAWLACSIAWARWEELSF